MPNLTVPTFAHVFEQELELLANPTCQGCNADPELKHPLLPWLLGENFHQTAERVVFVGKPHRGTPGEIRPSGVIDPTDEIFGQDGLWNVHWPYWSYTREIAENLYGPNAADYICFTNLIKCTNTHAQDATTREMAVGCVRELQVIWKEIEAIESRNAVFYTYSLYPDLLQNLPIALPGTIQQVTPYEHSVPCRNKFLGWWERTCSTAWCEDFRVLVVGHPERMGRPEFVELITNWLRQ
jgi:hypothetical protein